MAYCQGDSGVGAPSLEYNFGLRLVTRSLFCEECRAHLDSLGGVGKCAPIHLELGAWSLQLDRVP